MTCYGYHSSPIGRLLLVADEEGLRQLHLGASPREPLAGWRADLRPVDAVRRQLDEYFEGRRRAFDIRLAPPGTPFQQAVWRALLDIPCGTTVSYAQLAARVGRPSAVRAVGAANGANPIAILIPCHRVIGADGRLVGYSGGLERKEALLRLERGAGTFATEREKTPWQSTLTAS